MFFSKLFNKVTLREHYKNFYKRKYDERLANLIGYLDKDKLTLIVGDGGVIAEKSMDIAKDERLIVVGDNMTVTNSTFRIEPKPE